ncbi:PQQ-binding-like beta-propeller repeat protein [Streptomyces sp. NPDC059524]|uniref:outer membrane protein assembly factor BamB family protein n=1 Tax=Streptomyces sp. NPDC059524 TaxID=3346856 RepID=UPI0036AD45F1
MAFGPPPSPFTQSRQAESRDRKRRRSIALVSLGVVAGVLAVGGWLLWPKATEPVDNLAPHSQAADAPDDIRETVEDLPGKGGAGHLEVSMMATDLKPGKTVSTPGMWVTDKTLVKGRDTSLLGVRIKDDTNAWTKELPGEICATTPYVTVDGRTAVLYEDPQRGNGCNHLLMFDLDTGKPLWESTIPWKRPPMGEPTRVTMTRGVVVTTWQQGSAGTDMRTGKMLWERGRTKECYDGQAAGGEALLIRIDCAVAGGLDDVRYRIEKVDARTGHVTWSYPVAQGVDLPYVVSSSPAVLAVQAGEHEVTDLLSLDKHGKHSATIRMEGTHYNVDCSAERGDGCAGALVAENQVFIASGSASEELGNNTNWIVSFDLATGKSGVKFDAGQDQQLHLIRMSGDRALAVKEGTDEATPLSLVSLDPKTGKQQTYFYFSMPPESGSADGRSIIAIEDGRLFMGNEAVRGKEKDGISEARYMAFGVGPAK